LVCSFCLGQSPFPVSEELSLGVFAMSLGFFSVYAVECSKPFLCVHDEMNSGKYSSYPAALPVLTLCVATLISAIENNWQMLGPLMVRASWQ